MIPPKKQTAKKLSDAELDLVRDLWGSGVPLVRLATKFGLALAELERQLAEHRRQRFGEPRDLRAVAADLQQRIEERQRFSNWARPEGEQARQRGQKPGSADG
ncbi:MAG UNVERIFIED_CONTAM: hypothetical protein LVR18_02035 [Planctomycetaceae bacterium]|jgi:hypothetical protein